MTTDAQLVERALRGDREGFAKLVSRYQGHVYGLCYAILEDWHEAQDVSQEVFVRVYLNLGQLRQPDRFAGWLRRVAFSVCMNWLKTHRPRVWADLGKPEDVDQLEVADFRPGPPEHAEKRELADAVLRTVAKLPPNYRIPLTMFHLDGLSYKRVADFLEIPVSTVKVRLHRARKMLRKEVATMVDDVFAEHKLPEEFARKVLDGVPTLMAGTGKDCMFAGALEAATAVTEHPYDYADFMGYSGLAFRVRWHGGWCPSCTVGEMEEEILAVAKATGWQLHWKTGEGGQDMRRFSDDIVGDLNAGLPVLVYPPDLNLAVAYGYEDGGKTLLLRDYMKGEEEAKLPVAELGFLLIFLGDHVEPRAPQDAFVDSLRIAVHNWHRERGDEGPGGYFYGRTALQVWSADIERANSLSPGEREKLFFVNWLDFHTISGARHAAVAFLDQHASLLDGEARKAVMQAKEVYGSQCAEFGNIFGSKDAFFGPASGKSMRHWSAEVRGRERKILEEMQETDSAAISLLEEALSSIEAP